MLKYTFKRILLIIPMLFIITLLCFALMELAPYDAIDIMTGTNMPYEQVIAIKEKYGYDKPLTTRYFNWLGDILQGEFGYSIYTHRNVISDLKVRITNTALLIVPSYVSALLFSIILGMVSAYYKGKWQEKVIDGFCSIGMAAPAFWIAMLCIYIFAHKLKWFPVMGMYTIGGNKTVKDFLWHLFLPYFTLVFAFTPDLAKYIKASTERELTQPYVRTQKAIGLPPQKIFIKHILKNIAFVIITKASMVLPMVVTGAVITESVFGWPGVGPYFLQALQNFDYPVIMVILLLSSTMIMMGNLCADLLYYFLNPRIREGSINETEK